MVYGRLYESLQYILCRSFWPPIPVGFLASGSRSLFVSRGHFPGSWTCKAGVILWKQTTESPMLRVFPLHDDRRALVQELTKRYWQSTYGSNDSAGNHRRLLLRRLPKRKTLPELYGPGKSVIQDEKFSLTFSKSPVIHVAESKREQISPSSTVRSAVISLTHKFIEHTVGYLRLWAYPESPLAEGKARVRWRCVSGP